LSINNAIGINLAQPALQTGLFIFEESATWPTSNTGSGPPPALVGNDYFNLFGNAPLAGAPEGIVGTLNEFVNQSPFLVNISGSVAAGTASAGFAAMNTIAASLGGFGDLGVSGTAFATAVGTAGSPSGPATDFNANTAFVNTSDVVTNGGLQASIYGTPYAAIEIVKLTNGTDNDTPTGPIVPVGSTVTWTYNVTNPGNEPIASVVVTDDNGTPLDLLDDFNPAPTLVGGFNVGDLNTDNLLDPGELWVYTASALAVAGQYENYATVTGTSTISETPVEDDNPDHYLGSVPTFVLGPDKNPGVPQEVKVVDITGEVLASFPAYGNTYVGGTRIAIADLDGDGTDEIITAPGRNHAPEIKVFTLEGGEVPGFPSFLAYDEDFAGGVQLTVGYVNDDEYPDIITVPSYGTGEVRIFFNQYPSTPAFDATPDISFLAYPEATMFGAVVAAADMGSFVNDEFVNVLDGRAEIVVGTAGGITTKVIVWEVTGATPAPVAEFFPFTALNPNFLGGVSLDVAWIDQNADPTQDPPDILAGMGVNGTSQIEVWAWNTSDATLSMRGAIPDAFPPPSENAPVRVAGLDTNGDKIADSILAVQGPIGTTGEVRRFDIISSSPFEVSPPIVLSGFSGPWFVATSKTMFSDADSQGPLPGEPASALVWTNPDNSHDVNGEGIVSPLDVLETINFINTRPGETGLPAQQFTPPRFFDTNADGVVTPADALIVVNYLNRPELDSGEGEAAEAAGGIAEMASLLSLPLGLAAPGNALAEPNRQIDEALPALDTEVVPETPWRGSIPDAQAPVMPLSRLPYLDESGPFDLEFILEEISAEVAAAWLG
jgi:hypothetical protein